MGISTYRNFNPDNNNFFLSFVMTLIKEKNPAQMEISLFPFFQPYLPCKVLITLVNLLNPAL